MKIYEIVNYYSEDFDGIEARESHGLYVERKNAEDKLWELGNIFGIQLEDGQLSFERPPLGGLVSDYYALEERETDG